jgi:hypothetical protein
MNTEQKLFKIVYESLKELEEDKNMYMPSRASLFIAQKIFQEGLEK